MAVARAYKIIHHWIDEDKHLLNAITLLGTTILLGKVHLCEELGSVGLNRLNSWNCWKQFSQLLCVVTYINLRLVFSIGKNAEVSDCNWKIAGDELHLSAQLKLRLQNNLNNKLPGGKSLELAGRQVRFFYWLWHYLPFTLDNLCSIH